MAKDGKNTQPEAPKPPPVLYQATIVAPRETVKKLGPLHVDLLGSGEQWADGRWAQRALLAPDQIEGVVGTGATVILERIIDPTFPQDWIMSEDEAKAELDQLMARLDAKTKGGK